MITNFLLNIRNMFYTRSSRISEGRRFGYKLSMSMMMLPYYFIILSFLKKITDDSGGISVFNSDGENLIEKLGNSIIFFLPFVIAMFLMFRILDRHEKIKLTKSEETKWLGIASIIFFGGIIIMFTIPQYL